ncbi:MAG: type IV pilin protein [Proteobacteria bacterium]|nr:type IV pilin protein [Pseudomonadota bacterium]
MIKTRRAAAAACLLEMSQSLERYYTVNMTYMGDPLPNLDLQCSNDLAGYYAFDIQNLAARAYLLRADPIGAQADRDPALCRALTIDQAGQRGVEGEGAVNVCWK